MKFHSNYKDGGVFVVSIGSENMVIAAGDNECTGEEWDAIKGMYIIKQGLEEGWLVLEVEKQAKTKREFRKKKAAKKDDFIL